MKITNARPEHFPQIYSLICELEEASLDRSKLEAVYLRNLADPGIHYLIALENGEAAGFASVHVQYLLHHGGKIAELQEIVDRASAAGSSRKSKKPPERRDVYSWRYAATGNGRTATGFMSGRGWRPAILNSRRCWVGRNRREVCENAQSSGG